MKSIDEDFELDKRVAEFLNYPFINCSEIAFQLWGAKKTALFSQKRKKGNWLHGELKRLDEIRKAYIEQLQNNLPTNFL